MNIINYLGNIISENTNISSAAGRGLIKLAIKDEFGPFKSLKELVLDDYKLVLNNSLNKRFIQLGFHEPKKLSKLLLDELIQNQSLIFIYEV